jgi:hypothetical protein
MAQHEGCVVEVEVMTDSIFGDLDEPQDLAGFETRLAATS